MKNCCKFAIFCLLALGCGTDEHDDKLLIEDDFPDETQIKVRYSRFLSDIDKLSACGDNSRRLMTDQEWDDWEDNASHLLIYIRRARSQVENDGVEWDAATKELLRKAEPFLCGSREIAEKYCGTTDWAYKANGC